MDTVKSPRIPLSFQEERTIRTIPQIGHNKDRVVSDFYITMNDRYNILWIEVDMVEVSQGSKKSTETTEERYYNKIKAAIRQN